MWYHRRFSMHPQPEQGRPRRSVELRSLSDHGFVRHVPVEQWLREKDGGESPGQGPRPSSAEHDAPDIWYVVLCCCSPCLFLARLSAAGSGVGLLVRLHTTANTTAANLPTYLFLSYLP